MIRKAYMVSGLVALIFMSALLLLSRFTYSQAEVGDTFHELALSNIISGYYKQAGLMADGAVLDAYADGTAFSFAGLINSQFGNALECQQTAVTINNGSRMQWEGCCRYFCNGGTFASASFDSSQAQNAVNALCTYFEGLTPDFSPLNSTLISYLSQIENQTNPVLLQKGMSLELDSRLVLPSACSGAGPERNFSITSTLLITVNGSGIRRSNSVTRMHTIRLIPVELTRSAGGVTEYYDAVTILINDSAGILFNETMHLYTSYSASPCGTAADYFPTNSIASGALCVRDGIGT